MISLDSRRRTQSGPSNSRSGDQSLEETGAYSPAATSPPAVIVPAGPPAGRNRIDFLCTRRLPFEGDSVMAVLTSISTETPPAPKEGVLAVSRGMINGDGSKPSPSEAPGRGGIWVIWAASRARWISFPPLTVSLNDRLMVGVTAINSSTKPLTAEFERFEVVEKAHR